MIESAREQVVKLLTSEWLVTDVETPGGTFVHSFVSRPSTSLCVCMASANVVVGCV